MMSARERALALALRAAAFLSGAAALVFETLWFRQAGLLLGNAVWSSSIVLASFMAGLAIGNGVAGRWGARLRRPLRAYGALEVIVGVAGVALVAGLPRLLPVLMPALRASLANPGGLNALRTVVAFLLLIVPASAMGATLPVLVKALSRRDSRFGWTLGQLYGWNTMGAVAGTLSSEGFLISLLGVKGTALAALGLDATAAAIAWLLDRRARDEAEEPATPAAVPLATPWAALTSAFLAGGILLALEVVWFRFLLLNVVGTSRTFAAMLAVVLLGIAAGGLLASGWMRRRPAARRGAVVLALLAGTATIVSYARFQDVLRPLDNRVAQSMPLIVALAAPLMLPTCVLSGLLFTMIGDAVRQQAADDARATGLVTLSNTVGAMLGALLGGFVLLPGLGIERSLYVLSLAYLGVAAGVLPAAGAGSAGRQRVWAAAAVLLYVLALATFPFGLMARRYLLNAIQRWVPLKPPDGEVVAVREGLSETVMVTRGSRWGTPVSYRLLTNAISMSGWDQTISRYMRAFVYLPVALNPPARRALLISYGVGVTAKALTDTASLQSIDVVDVSRDIVRATRVVYPVAGQHPLDDPRVKLHIEDGRFYLASRADTYDIITGEPPPPTAAGVSTLYSREYFELMRRRLAEGGIVSYWLPVHQMYERDSKAITAAFCAAFPDCSLWHGCGAQWILLGTRNARPVDEAGFARQWEDPRVRWELEAMGFERPEDLGTMFMADADTLAEWTSGMPPVDDDHPHRITPQAVNVIGPYYAFAEVPVARARFAGSAFVRRLWPAGLRARTIDAFAEQSPVLRDAWTGHRYFLTGVWDLYALLEQSSLRTPVLWFMGADALVEQSAQAAHARGLATPDVDEVLGISAMADRNYTAAEALFARAQPHAASPNRLLQWRVLALCLSGDRSAAAALMAQSEGKLRVEDRPGWLWLSEAFGLPDVFRLRQAAP